MKKRLGVIGAGSAGVLSLCSMVQSLSNDWEIVSIFDPKKEILGIGESTNPNFLTVLQSGIDFLVTEDLEKLDGTIKWGTNYQYWRRDKWLNPLFGSGYAIHFNNFKLKEFVFSRITEKYGSKFKIIEGEVESLTSTFTHATVKVNGNNEIFDWIIDCRGFPEDYTDYVISDCSPVNHCLVYSVPPFNNGQVTDHFATKHGWTFGIPLTNRYTYGYLFNNNINTKEEAMQGFEELINSPINRSELKEYKFTPYYAKKIIDKRILKNGNRALFFEPLSASSIFIYTLILEVFLDHLEVQSTTNPFADGSNTNKLCIKMINDLEDIISFLYHGGSIYDTEFWRYASDKGKSRLQKSEVFHKILPEYIENYKKGLYNKGSSWYFTVHSLRVIDKKMGYNYFSKEE